MICKEVNCETRALYSIKNSEKPEYCRAHKKEIMIDVLSKRCNFINCDKHRIYGIVKGKPEYCSTHKLENMIDCITKKCIYKDCTVKATYDKKYCATHKKDNSKKQKQCITQGCGKYSIFGEKGGDPLYCDIHKLENMVNIKKKYCLEEKCKFLAKFGIKNEEALYCITHKKEEMINLNNKICVFSDCKKQPSFGKTNNKPEYCVKHKLEGMENVKDKTCLETNCRKQPSFGIIDKTPTHCGDHKSSNMKNVKDKHCTSCGLYRVVKKNDYLCYYCQPTPRMMKKETKVKTLLEENNLEFVHNKQFKNDCCLKYRCDFLFDCNTYFVALECDEDQHSSYDKDCELIRMNNISIGLGMPTLFIRYNPDLPGFKVKQKHKKLLETLEKYLNMEVLEDPTPIYLFYKEKF
jgi:hypothetical protein